jgi:hypothetical protein
MNRHALERVARCEVMSGLIAVHQRSSIGSIVDDLLRVAACSLSSNWAVRDNMPTVPIYALLA